MTEYSEHYPHYPGPGRLAWGPAAWDNAAPRVARGKTWAVEAPMHEPQGLTRALVLLALGPGLALAACASAPSAAPAPPPAAPAAPAAEVAANAPARSAVQPLSPPVAVKAGSTGLVGDSGVFAALARGYFQEEGLDVDLVPLRNSSESLPSLAIGELSFASSAVDGSLLNAVARDITFKIVGFNAVIPATDTTGGIVV